MFEENTLLNPVALIQVLSSGEDGRSSSLADYDLMPSLQEVWFVFQDRCVVHHNRRLGPLQWMLRTYDQNEVSSEALGIALSVETIYRGVPLDPNPSLR